LALCGGCLFIGTVLEYFNRLKSENPSKIINGDENGTEREVLLKNATEYTTKGEEDQPMWVQFFMCFSVQKNLGYLVNDKHSSGSFGYYNFLFGFIYLFSL
jgi:hypothetical protein